MIVTNGVRVPLRVLTGALLVGVVFAAAGPGSAASLTITAGSVSTAIVEKPCSGSLAATTPSTSTPVSAVTVTAPATCSGRQLQVAVTTGGATVEGAAAVPESGVVTVGLNGAYTPSTATQVSATVDGWNLPATWAYTPPPAGAITCYPVDPSVTATCAVSVTGWSFWGSGYRLDFTVTTPSPTPFEWEVRLDLSATGQQAPGGGTLFPGYPVPAAQWWSTWTPTHFSASNVCADSRSGEVPVVRLRGSGSWNRTVSASAPAQSMGFQANQSGSGTINALACG